jgi:DNA modification methylase
MNIDLRLGDCLEVLKTIPDNSIDAVITDPPYHLTSIVKRFGKEDSAPAQFGTDGAYARASKGFMGKEWDGGDIAFRTDVWEECLRVLKPGGHLLAFSHSRTYHRMAVAVEDAGFEIRDQIMWVYGSGFPKSHNIGKAIDKIEGNEGKQGELKRGGEALTYDSSNYGSVGWNATKRNPYQYIAENNWEGWGTALKPAHEPIVMARKPLSEKSIAENVLKHGTGGINIDGSRITIGQGDKTSAGHRTCNIFETEKISGGNGSPDYETHEGGRFPANIIFDEEAGQLLDEQSDKASRFFYCAKAAKKDRGEGIELINNHPTVKPTDLMRYLINLITPPNGTILDPFMGSGSTGKAAVRCGVNFIGIEKEQEYMDIASARIEHEKNKPVQQKLFNGKE